MKNINAFQFILSLCAATSFSVVAVQKEDCISAISADKHDSILNICAPGFSTEKGRSDLVFGETEHYLGSIESPSIAVKMIERKAEDGDAVYQYIWGLVNSLVYSPSLPKSKKEALQASIMMKKSKEEGRKWLFKSADQGLVESMLLLIRNAVNNSHRALPESEHTRLVYYANALKEAKEPEAERLLEKLISLSNDSQIAEEFENNLFNYTSLTDEAIFDIAAALTTGYFQINQNGIRRIYVGKDKDNSEKLFRYLVDKRESVKAAYALSNSLMDRKSNPEIAAKILELRKIASAGKHPISMRLIGVHLACNGQLDEAIDLLNESDKLGDTEALSYVEEINEYGDIYECNDQ